MRQAAFEVSAFGPLQTLEDLGGLPRRSPGPVDLLGPILVTVEASCGEVGNRVRAAVSLWLAVFERRSSWPGVRKRPVTIAAAEPLPFGKSIA